MRADNGIENTPDVAAKEIRPALGLDPGTSTLFLMDESMGYGNMQKSLIAPDKLPTETDFQIIAVCGNNEKAKNKSRPQRRAAASCASVM